MTAYQKIFQTGARRVVLNGIEMWACKRCGGYYTTEKQASYGGTARFTIAEGTKGHRCAARPR